MKPCTRRHLLTAGTVTLAGAAAAVVGAPVAVAFFDPVRKKTIVDEGAAVAAPYGKVGDFVERVPRMLPVIAERHDAWERSAAKPVGAIWVVRRGPADVAAFTAECPHLGCPVGFDAKKQVFACPCHDSAFALEDGARIEGPSARGLDPLPVELRDGAIYVTFKRFVQAIAERKER